MSLLSKVKGVPSHLPHGLTRSGGIKGFVLDKGERMAMGAALGAVKGYYYDKAVWRGIGIEAIVGVLGSLGCALMPSSALAPHFERAADTGFTTIAYALGASWGADKAGRGVAVSKQVGPKQQAVGVIPPRSGGAFLSPEQIANYAGPR